jgi:hypothetical protein
MNQMKGLVADVLADPQQLRLQTQRASDYFDSHHAMDLCTGSYSDYLKSLFDTPL